MKNHRLIIASAIALAGATPPPLAAQTQVPVAQFRSIELNGGGHVKVRHGPVQRVTIVKGSTQYTDIAVSQPGTRRHRNMVINDDGQRLTIDACKRQCPERYDLEIEIETPDLAALAVNGGGQIDVGSGFSRQQSLALAVNGGGGIDARTFPVDSAAASVRGGGSLLVQPRDSMAASVVGGGEVVYWGDPTVTSSIVGGGLVHKGQP